MTSKSTKHFGTGLASAFVLTLLLTTSISAAEADSAKVAEKDQIAAEGPAPKERKRFFQHLGDRLFGARSDKKQKAGSSAGDKGGEDLPPELSPNATPPSFKPGRAEIEAEKAVKAVYEEVLAATANFNGPETRPEVLAALPQVPPDFDATWRSGLQQPANNGQSLTAMGLEDVYSSAFRNSTQVRSYLRTPRVQEALIRENRALFHPEFFVNADYINSDEPTGSILTTGKTGRFREESIEGEAGFRSRLTTGGEVSISQRITSLKNNSEFLDPNPQTGSEVVLSVAQPLLRGAGATYNRTEIRLAELGRDLARGEALRLLEEFLLEVNRSYWGVYLSRAALIQRRMLTDETSKLVNLLEERQKLDETATVSELFRARAMMNRRQADLRRTSMAVVTADNKLRSLMRHPALPLGASGELVPSSAPIISAPVADVHAVASEALLNRPEMIQASISVRAAAVRLAQAKSELRPQLDLVGEAGYNGISDARNTSNAMDDMTENDIDWRVGLRFSVPLGNVAARARHEARKLEYEQALDAYRIQGESVLLQTLVAYQDLVTSYQDMAGKFQSLTASRREIEQLKDRLKVDDEDSGKTVAYQLQVLLGAVDRNQVAEEEFLVAVVAYNTAVANLQRAEGTLLKVETVAAQSAE